VTGPAFLLSHSIKRARNLVLTTGALLALFQVLLIFVALAIRESGGFQQLSELLPAFVKQLMGAAFTRFVSFFGIVCA